MVSAKLGRTATKNAGGWSREKTVDTYRPEYEPEHIANARKLMEDAK